MLELVLGAFHEGRAATRIGAAIVAVAERLDRRDGAAGGTPAHLPAAILASHVLEEQRLPADAREGPHDPTPPAAPVRPASPAGTVRPALPASPARAGSARRSPH